jgi:regulation of enolase protein 1 (concanavalin A-like superfamily)
VDLSEFRSVQPEAWRFEGGRLTGVAGPRTDLFINPATGAPTLDAPRLLAPARDGEFQLVARVTVGFAGTFDAGSLLLWGGDTTWGKLAFEYSPQGRGMAVSVITQGLSDDANGFVVDGDALWLRVSRVAGAYAFHAALDGTTWQFVRHFWLPGQLEFGFEVQSPTGEGVTATFSEIRLLDHAPADLRDGS